jgi:hypothetical protein
LKDFRRVLFCLSQKLIVPSEPAVEKVPCTGWNEIALTANSWALVSSVVRPVPALGSLARWHLKEKFSLERHFLECMNKADTQFTFSHESRQYTCEKR